jgi:microcystin-dependent protein
MDGTIASILMFASNFAPQGWALCQGQILPISQNTALFSIIGTTYGGNGQTTFGLPDLRGRTTIGSAQGPGLSNFSWGQTGGANTVTLTTNNLPAHTHVASVNVACSSNNATSDEAYGAIPAGVNNVYASANAIGGNLGGVNLTVSPAGGGQPFNNQQPYLGINFIICLFGIFPSRN